MAEGLFTLTERFARWVHLQEAWSYNRGGLKLQLKMGGLTGGVVLPVGVVLNYS